MQFNSLIDPISKLAREAGAAIMQVYNSGDHGVVSKDDNSPLTKADLAAHKVIVSGLQLLTPDVPILSEEAAGISWKKRQAWQTYWLVDPLDGTKEFIKGNGEFTVNIALIMDGIPVLGVVYAPVLNCLYVGSQGRGATKETTAGVQEIAASTIGDTQTNLKVVASRSHQSEALEAWLEEVEMIFPEIETVNMGSSLKICLVAEGKADIYPRLGPTCEWDTAAAQAVLEAAGGALVDKEWEPYRYNRKDSLLNPDFFAVGDKEMEYPRGD